MTGEKDLDKLLAGMAPELLDGEYVFCTFQHARYGDRHELEPIAAVRETEGLTLIIPKTRADANSLPYDSVQKCITLRIHSSLDAVGLTAAFSRVLSSHGISANVVAGYYHDHIFVQSEQAENAMQALAEFAY
jgi:hypothetical protein